MTDTIDFDTASGGTTDPMTGRPSGAEANAEGGPILDSPIGRLAIRHLVGQGAFGSVYLAEVLGGSARETTEPRPDESSPSLLPNHCAIKVFRSEVQICAKDIAKRELSALRSLRSNRVPRLLAYNMDQPPYYMITPYYCDGCLADRPEEHGEFPESEAWTLLTHLLEAVRDAHAESLLHLDIKPGNILRDGCGGYLLTDFGISQNSLERNNKLGGGFGTPGYQAPEQWLKLADELDMRTDLFGIGMTLWYLLTGTERTEESIRAMRQSVKDGASRPVSRTQIQATHVSSELAEIVDLMTNTRKADRPASAADLLRRVRGSRAAHSCLFPGPGKELSAAEKQALLDSITDQSLVSMLLSKPSRGANVYGYDAGEILGFVGEKAFNAFLLLQGSVRIEREGAVLATVDREGSFLGEIAALTFEARTANMIAETKTIVLRVNASEFEDIIGENPALVIRMLRSLAQQVRHENRLARSGVRPKKERDGWE